MTEKLRHEHPLLNDRIPHSGAKALIANPLLMKVIVVQQATFRFASTPSNIQQGAFAIWVGLRAGHGSNIIEAQRTNWLLGNNRGNGCQ